MYVNPLKLSIAESTRVFFPAFSPAHPFAMAHVAGFTLLNDPIFGGKVHLHQCVGHLLLLFRQQRI